MQSEIEIPENASFLDPAFMAKIKYEDDDDDNIGGDDNDESYVQVVKIFARQKGSETSSRASN